MALTAGLQGRSFIVTGASSGIGAATVARLADEGAFVLAVARRSDPALFPSNDRVRPFAADLGDADAIAGIVEAAAERGPIDGILHAGGHFSHAPLGEARADELDELWRVHVRAPYLLTQAALPHLATGSSVVFVSSTVVRAGFAPYAAYSAVKGAVDAMARSLAMELAPRTRVNTLMPGFTATPMMGVQYPDAPGLEQAITEKTPLRTIGDADYAAATAVFLLGDSAGYSTGSTVVVDGGWSAQGWQ